MEIYFWPFFLFIILLIIMIRALKLQSTYYIWRLFSGQKYIQITLERILVSALQFIVHISDTEKYNIRIHYIFIIDKS